MSTALGNVFSLERHRARFARVDHDDPHHERPVVRPRRLSSRRVAAERPQTDSSTESTTVVATPTTTTTTTTPRNNNEETAPEVDDVDIDGLPIFTTRATMTLAELEEDRELARRRSSICILLAAFVLFRMWIWAIQEGDFGLLLLCLVGTSWTARWISYNREREEELDRRIANYLENSEPGITEVDRNELRMLSFQAQLALAIMESQRQMMQGGFGHPDGNQENRGVSAEAKAKWEHFKFKADTPDDAKKKGSYGSVLQKDEKAGLVDEGPHCSICLSEYEDGEEIVKLPCHHLYHGTFCSRLLQLFVVVVRRLTRLNLDECISSWTSSHVKCPLCNFDLESVATADNSSSQTDDSIV